MNKAKLGKVAKKLARQWYEKWEEAESQAQALEEQADKIRYKLGQLLIDPDDPPKWIHKDA